MFSLPPVPPSPISKSKQQNPNKTKSAQIKQTTKNNKKTPPKEFIFCYSQLLLARAQSWNVVDTPCGTLLEKTDFPIASSDELKTASWKGV